MKIFLFSCLLALLAIHAHATTLVYKSFDDLVKECDGIIMGTVTNIEARIEGDGDIYTYVTLSDLTILHGRYKKKEFTLRMKGGQVGQQGLHVAGSPSFQYKEKVILFVKGNGRKIVPLVGWGQGVFRVQKDPQSGQEVINDNEGNRVFAIENGHVVKEKRVPSEAEIVSGPPPIHPYSKPAEVSVGVTEKGEPVKPLDSQESLVAKKPLRLDEFTKEIQSRAKQMKIAAIPLVSIAIGETIQVPKGVDKRPQTVTESGTIKQAPSTEKRPGELPKRIDTDAEKKEAEKKEAEKKPDQF